MRDCDLQHPDITAALATGYPCGYHESEEEETEVTTDDALQWLIHIVDNELDGDGFYKQAVENMLEALQDMIGHEGKARLPVSAAVREIADMYEDDIKEFKEDHWW